MKQAIAQFLNVNEFPFKIHDSNGNVIYYENSNGFWYKQEFDSNGNKTYYEHSDGFWYKQEFDSNGNRIYYEDSNGYWLKQEFDSNGNRIYYEDSNGNKEDNRSSCENKVVEIGGVKYKLSKL